MPEEKTETKTQFIIVLPDGETYAPVKGSKVRLNNHPEGKKLTKEELNLLPYFDIDDILKTALESKYKSKRTKRGT